MRQISKGATPLRALLLAGSALFAAAALLPGVAVAQNSPGAAAKQASAPERRGDITEYIVDGNTLLAAIEVQRAVYPFEGPQRPVSDTEKARAALEKAYADRGY